MAVNINKGNSLDSLNMTPLIDIVFLLLIFFLVATKFEEQERALDIKHPEASEAMPLTSRVKEFVINIDSKGRYIVNGKVLSVAGLDGVLAQAAANNPQGQKVIIRADGRVVYQYVVTAINLCLKNELRDYVATARKETDDVP
jgi:biopolymer transport protein ExbD